MSDKNDWSFEVEEDKTSKGAEDSEEAKKVAAKREQRKKAAAKKIHLESSKRAGNNQLTDVYGESVGEKKDVMESNDKPATLQIRAIAKVIDYIFVAIGTFGLIYLTETYLAEDIADFKEYIPYVAGALNFLIWIPILESRNGQSIGKMLTKIEVIHQKGETLTFTQVLFRETLGNLLTLVTLFSFIPAVFEKKHKMLHDYMFKTDVLKL